MTPEKTIPAAEVTPMSFSFGASAGNSLGDSAACGTGGEGSRHPVPPWKFGTCPIPEHAAG